MVAHTPGPWRVGEVVAELGDVYILSGKHHVVGRAYAYEDDSIVDGHAYANARLIAAAPELLEVVREYEELLGSALMFPFDPAADMMACASCGQYQRGEAEEHDSGCEYAALQTKAAAALARVEGTR